MVDPHTELSPLAAYQSVLDFAARRGENALRLALHAALPQVLRPELLHLLRLNFVPEALDDNAAEADVLFAPFCAELGNGYFRFDPNARQHLLTQLDPAYGHEVELRSRQVAGFMLAWCQREDAALTAEEDRVFAAFLDVERWVALAFFDPAAAAAQLAAAVRQASEIGAVAARIRIGGLASALATPLAGHGRLLAYAAGLEALELGDVGRAEDLLGPLGNRELEVGGIVLRSPVRLLAERGRRVESGAINVPEPEVEVAESEPLAEEPVTESEAQVEKESEPKERGLIFLSYCSEDTKMAVELANYLKALAWEEAPEVWLDYAWLRPNDDWVKERETARSRAIGVIILLSSAYLASDYLIEKELPRFLNAASNNNLLLTWVCVDYCLWKEMPLAGVKAAHNPERPIRGLSYESRAKVWDDVAELISESTLYPNGIRLDARKPKKSARIYLASTFDDLAEYRQSAMDALHRLGHRIVEAESFDANNPGRVEQMLQRIAESDVFLCLVAWRYGRTLDYREDPEGLSITEREYREARRLGKPIFVFLSDDEAPWSKGFDPRIEGKVFPIENFRDELAATHDVAYFTSPDNLATKVSTAITAWQAGKLNAETDTSHTATPPVSPEAQALLAELARPETTHARRLEIGDTLDKLGDPRPGVGLRPDGVPDILWLPVPGGTVRLEGIDQPFEVRPFRIAKYPVTYRQYRAFLDDPEGYDNPTWWTGLQRQEKPGEQRWPLGNRPAERVSWYDAVAYARWLSALLGYEVRLPTEMEWQQAATGGEPERAYPWGKDWDATRANIGESELRQTTAAGMYPEGAAPCGALDLAGNVWEWCLNDYRNPERSDIQGDGTRAVRGGSWYDDPVNARGACRLGSAPGFRLNTLGLRLVSAPPIA